MPRRFDGGYRVGILPYADFSAANALDRHAVSDTVVT